MEKTLKLFSAWKVEQPAMRRAMFVHASHQRTEENILYMICCWDYVFKPSDEKLDGLVDVFLRPGSEGEINVSYRNRKAVLRSLNKPTAPIVMLEGSNKQVFFKKFLRKGGRRTGGVANYNLMTKAIETTLPECMGQINDVSGSNEKISDLMLGGAGNLRPTPEATKLVRLISRYWGAAVVDLQIA